MGFIQRFDGRERRVSYFEYLLRKTNKHEVSFRYRTRINYLPKYEPTTLGTAADATHWTVHHIYIYIYIYIYM